MSGVRVGIMRHVATAVVVLTLQSMAVLMTMRRDPVARFEGTAISAALRWTTRPQPVRARPRPSAAAGSRRQTACRIAGGRFARSASASASSAAGCGPPGTGRRARRAIRMPPGQRLEALVPLERVHPDQLVRLPGDRRQLPVEQRQVAALPAVAGDHDHRPPGHPPPAVARLYVRSDSPIRVPPPQSGKGAAALSEHRGGIRPASSAVSR